MTQFTIVELQKSALSKINFVLQDLKMNPPLQIDSATNAFYENISRRNRLGQLTSGERKEYVEKLKQYLKRESIIECKLMLIMNYLAALLIKARNNQISIHQNRNIDCNIIENFEKKNSEILNKIKTVRDKLYSHIDLDWAQHVKNISFDEIDTCVIFLNDVLDFHIDI